MLNKIQSDTGNLTAIDIGNIPFVPKRIFIVDNVPIGSIRGNHAHIKDNQILYCLSGQLEITTTNKISKTTTICETGTKVYIPILTWCSIKFLENNSSFMCICSERYDESEYIRDYNKFIDIVSCHR